MKDAVRVEFSTADDVTLRGNFYQASGDQAPIIVMTNGLTLLKEHFLEPVARQFQGHGISALVYDHRSYGSSDGLPRHQTDPLKQAEDYHDAVTAAMELPGVDSSRVAVWGIGHGAVPAIIAAADDPRVSAVVVHAPFFSGSRDASSYPSRTFERIWRGREHMALSTNVDPVYERVWPESLANARGEGEQAWVRGEAAFNFICEAVELSHAAGTPWENRMTLQSFYYIARVEAQWYLSRIKQPLLYVIAEDDPFAGPVEAHRDAFLNAGIHAEFSVIPAQPGIGISDWLEPAIAVQIGFLIRHLQT